jgi:hypothetical protein
MGRNSMAGPSTQTVVDQDSAVVGLLEGELMKSKESKREFIESLRNRLTPSDFTNLLLCLDPELGYATESLKYRLSQIAPERLAFWEKERVELQERIREQEAEPSWCDPFIARLPPPRRPDLDTDDVTDMVKYLFATLSRAIAELQYQLAELAGTGRLDTEANEHLQWNWCFRYWEFLYNNTTAAVRNEETSDDWNWDTHDNTYSTGQQVMSRVQVEPHETDEDHWQYNEHLCGDGAVQEYPRGAISHISEPPLGGRKGESRDNH